MNPGGTGTLDNVLIFSDLPKVGESRLIHLFPEFYKKEGQAMAIVSALDEGQDSLLQDVRGRVASFKRPVPKGK